MKYSTNYNLNLPELADQFNLKHQNKNTEKIDTELKTNADAISAETSRATQKENAINDDLTSHKNDKNNPHEVTKNQVGLGNVPNYSFETFWTKIKEKIASILGLTEEQYAGNSATATNAVNDENGKNIAATFMPRGIDFSSVLFEKNGLPQTSTTTYTATKDCWLFFQNISGSTANTAVNLKVNDTYLIKNSWSGQDQTYTIQMPLVKGDVVTALGGYANVFSFMKVYGYKY